MRYTHFKLMMCAVLTVSILCAIPIHASADSARQLSRDAQIELQKLYDKSASAKALGEKAKGILVFPAIVKGGFMVGGQYGEGALLKSGTGAGYYSFISLSYGLQAGIQKYAYVMFFMTDAALDYVEKTNGWELGAGPSIVVVDKGMAGGISTTTAKSDIYAFFLSQKGLMAGIGLQGAKITRIDK